MRSRTKIALYLTFLFGVTAAVSFGAGMQFKAHQISRSLESAFNNFLSEEAPKLSTSDENLSPSREDIAPKDETVPSIAVGQSIKVDGILITPTQVRIGTLSKKKETFYSYPKGELLLVDVKLKNISDNAIITLQNVWEDTSLVDNFGNAYSSLNAQGANGVWVSGKLRPQDEISDIIVFELPLSEATEFYILADPNFFKSDGRMTLMNLSSSEVKMDFLRKEFGKSE